MILSQLGPALTEIIDGKMIEEIFQGTLETLDLNRKPVTEKDFEFIISHIPKIEKLFLTATIISDFSCLKKSQFITHLCLEYCHNITLTSFKIFSEFANLYYISLTGSFGVNDEALNNFAVCHSLRFCDLSECINITDNGISRLPITIECLFMRCLPKLTKNCPLLLSKMVHLDTVDLSENIFSFKKLSALSPLTNLKNLYLWRCITLEDDHLSWLQGRNLMFLDVSYCRSLTDNCITHLHKVQNINLDGCVFITDSGLKGMIGSDILQSISLERCPSLTSGIISSFPSHVTVHFGLNASLERASKYY
jgi:hypothetical protein